MFFEDVDLEGICGRFGRFGGGRFAYRPARGASSDDAGVSFTVLAWLSLDGLAGTETDPGPDPGQMCEGSTSRICGEHFRKGSRIGVRD